MLLDAGLGDETPFTDWFVPVRSATGHLGIDGVRGGSTARGHEDEIDVFAVAWSMRQRPATRGGARATVDVSELSVTMPLGPAAPHLIEAVAVGGHFRSARLSFASVDGTEATRVELSDVEVSGFVLSGEGGMPAARVTLGYGSILIAASPRSTDGEALEPEQVHWDLTRRRLLSPPRFPTSRPLPIATK